MTMNMNMDIDLLHCLGAAGSEKALSRKRANFFRNRTRLVSSLLHLLHWPTTLLMIQTWGTHDDKEEEEGMTRQKKKRAPKVNIR